MGVLCLLIDRNVFENVLDLTRMSSGRQLDMHWSIHLDQSRSQSLFNPHFSTHNPTHSESRLVGFPRILAVPAVL